MSAPDFWTRERHTSRSFVALFIVIVGIGMGAVNSEYLVSWHSFNPQALTASTNAADPMAADKQCPVEKPGQSKYAGKVSPETYVENNVTITNLSWKTCTATGSMGVEAQGFCVLKDGQPECKADSCGANGQPCALPPGTVGGTGAGGAPAWNVPTQPISPSTLGGLNQNPSPINGSGQIGNAFNVDQTAVTEPYSNSTQIPTSNLPADSGSTFPPDNTVPPNPSTVVPGSVGNPNDFNTLSPNSDLFSPNTTGNPQPSFSQEGPALNNPIAPTNTFQSAEPQVADGSYNYMDAQAGSQTGQPSTTPLPIANEDWAKNFNYETAGAVDPSVAAAADPGAWTGDPKLSTAPNSSPAVIDYSTLGAKTPDQPKDPVAGAGAPGAAPKPADNAGCDNPSCFDKTPQGSPPDKPATPAAPPAGPAAPAAPATPSGADKSGAGGGSGSLGSALSSLLGGLAKGLAQALSTPAAPAAAAAQACSTDSNTYSQQQQQYQTALQNYNTQLQQYNYQLQLNAAYGNTNVAPIAPVQPSACTPSTQQQCATQPSQPAASSCTSGSWQPVYSGTCIANWQCSNLGAQLSCQPQTADVGMSVSISYSCAQGTAAGSGFTATGQSGTASTTVAAPPAGANTVTYGLTCTNQGQTAGAQCSVQINTPSIVLISNPQAVRAGNAATIGWVTSGMQSCVISSPDQADFTAANAYDTSVTGAATTSPITSSATFQLNCTTLAGGTKQASVSVGTTASGSLSVSSTAEGNTISHGDTTTVTWQSAGEPATAAVALWLVDVRTGATTALVAGSQATSGTYSWTLPAASSTCSTDSANVCGSDLVAGRQYEIEADVYTPQNAYVGDGARPADAVDPTYGDYADTKAFTVGQ